jgi:hypothetical protein
MVEKFESDVKNCVLKCLKMEKVCFIWIKLSNKIGNTF